LHVELDFHCVLLTSLPNDFKDNTVKLKEESTIVQRGAKKCAGEMA